MQLLRFIKDLLKSVFPNRKKYVTILSSNKEKVYMTKHQYKHLLFLQIDQFNHDFTEYRDKIIKIID